MLRSVNVGKHNRVKMADLRRALRDEGLGETDTYLQSGNVLFDHPGCDDPELDRFFSAAFARLNIATIAVIRSPDELIRLAESDLFVGHDVPDGHKFATFLKSPAEVHLAQRSQHGDIEIVSQSRTEICSVYRPIEARPGFMRDLVERAAGKAVTTRNWNVTRELARLASESASR